MKNIMKTLFVLLTIVAMVTAVPPDLEAQSSPPITTLSAILPAGSGSTAMTVVSNTGISATGWSCLVDHELVNVTATSGSTGLTVQRSVRGNATAHPSGSYVLCGPRTGTFNTSTGSTSGVFLSSPPTGTCTSANNQYLPVVVASGANPYAWEMANCNNGRWVRQTLIDDVGASITRYCIPQFVGTLSVLTSFGGAASPITMGVDTTPIAQQWYYGTVEIPKTILATGGSMLNGTVAATDTLIYALLRADGTTIANTATAGTTAANLGRYQDIAFTATELVTGPARYWIAVQSSGATTRIRTLPLSPGATTAGLGAWTGALGSNFLGTTGTVPANFASVIVSGTTAVTALPTALIAGSAPVACIY